MFSIDETTVAQLRLAMDNGSITCVDLVLHYVSANVPVYPTMKSDRHSLGTKQLSQIEEVNSNLHAVIETNPDALALAKNADAERLRLETVPLLHGIPILIKDNIATRDKMQTTAGSYILVDSVVPQDAFLVSKLREAGAIIIGKTNLSEWSNWRIGDTSPNGWSGRGGQTINPFGGEVGGSSSGSAVAATMNLAAVTLGSETDGSIIYPASLNGVVGIKPTVGFVSRNGVIPISHTQDCVGPITRTVADAAAVLDAIVGSDPADLVTIDADKLRPKTSFVAELSQVKTLESFRIGFDSKKCDRYSEHAVTILESMGAQIINIELPNLESNESDEITILSHEFKQGINLYLSQLSNCRIKTLEDVISETIQDARENIYPVALFEKSQKTSGLNDEIYLNAMRNQSLVVQSIKNIFETETLDAIIGIANDLSSTAAISGYPVITVPAPSNTKWPQAVGFMAKAFGDARLLQIAYAYERRTNARKKPEYVSKPMETAEE
ncbi:hypothetical protein HK100_012235 [Physocladia obscura]|uniref:Amidase domain-containing protein n=1 Tax=Physocladia obscura TaxID=109957 RepID=A0AAD5XDG0_9FUNG|nr:hypothetical protein HK100_012235 [Physocladia obscura]